MELSLERVLLLYGPSLAKLKLAELEIQELKAENAQLRALLTAKEEPSDGG